VFGSSGEPGKEKCMSTTSPVQSSSSGNVTGQMLSTQNNINQQEFLQLLITQLSNQDPTAPVDNQQFLAEMAQFSTVQGVTNLDSSMSQVQGAALVGRTVQGSVVANGMSQPISGVVSSVSFQSDGVHLTVNNQDVPLAQVTQVSQ
jgi:flagellar basal-body rod modification protein FlgD